jgi:hypothetical protein
MAQFQPNLTLSTDISLLGGQVGAGIAALTAIISHLLSLDKDGKAAMAQVYSTEVNLHLTGFSFLCRDQLYCTLPTKWQGRCVAIDTVPDLHIHLMADMMSSGYIPNLGSFLETSLMPQFHSYFHKDAEKALQAVEWAVQSICNPILENPSVGMAVLWGVFCFVGIPLLENSILNLTIMVHEGHDGNHREPTNIYQFPSGHGPPEQEGTQSSNISQSGTCTILNETCCLYINVTGKVEENLKVLKGNIKTIDTLKAQSTQISWLGSLFSSLGHSRECLPFLGPLILVGLALCFDLCVLNCLTQVSPLV